MLAAGLDADMDLAQKRDPHAASTSHGVKQHGRIGSHPYEQLLYYLIWMAQADAMHTMAGVCKGTLAAVAGKEVTKAAAKYESTENKRQANSSQLRFTERFET